MPSPFLFDQQMPQERQGREGVACDGSPNMEITALVPSCNRDFDRLSLKGIQNC